MEVFLRSTDIVNWDHPQVRHWAESLARGLDDKLEVARRCFEWVRDEIKHSRDFRLSPVTCSASEVLEAGSGYCFAKSHLLAALLRANGIPSGFSYQRLSRDGDGAPYTLHGLNAVYLTEFGWYRVDPRGNRPGVDAQFCPPKEQLAYKIVHPGEADLPEIWPDPLPVVIEALASHETADSLWHDLPDVPLAVTVQGRGQPRTPASPRYSQSD